MIEEIGQEFLDAVLKIERICFAEPWTRGMFEKELESPHSKMWGWLEDPDRTLLGYLVGWLIYEEFHIANIAVVPERRGEGVAKALLQHALDWAVERHAERSLLEVRASNSAAISLYRDHGFALVGARRNYYRFPTEDALIFQKRLSRDRDVPH